MNDPSCPPDATNDGLKRCVRRRLSKSLLSYLCLTVSFAALFILVFSAAAYLARNREWIKDRADSMKRMAAVPAARVLPELREIMSTFERNQTITQAFAQQGLPAPLVQEVVECARSVYNLAKVTAGRPYWLRFTQDGDFRDFRYPVNDDQYLTVYHDVGNDRLVSVMKSFSYETRVEPVTAVIEDSLFGSVSNIGEQDQLALELAEIFSSDIDFYSDIQSGDSFTVLIEKKYLDGQFAKYGSILAAEFHNDQKLFAGFRFKDEEGKPAYFAADGKSLKKSFLKSPLKFARISSKFSFARRHPVLRTVRPHLGVDYAASIGTPVQAVADGVVTMAGYRGGNGRMIKVRHTGGYETMYLHLSRIAVRNGSRVRQGQVIGNVGSTGLSTGPHLDFRVVRKGTPLNPLKIISPPGNPVPSRLFAEFAALRDNLSGQLRVNN